MLLRNLMVVSVLVFSVPALAADRVVVPEATFPMGCSLGDPACDADEGPVGGTPVRVPAFAIDRNEVTVEQYRACVSDGRCTAPLTNRDNQYCNYDHPERDQHPVNCVDWSQAVAYCASAAGRLPTEPEWERAARAGSVSRYPWGQEVSCREAILDEVSPAPSQREPDGCYADATWVVASRPANALGLHDMHGNVGEWTSAWYGTRAIAELYAQGDLAGPPQGRQRVVRGGSWDEDRLNLRSSLRNVKPPRQGEAIYGSVGFRCAADID